jgi:O-antigen biosynthesis protein WbqV
LGDVRDRTRLDEVMAAHAPELVFHAAALKHVPMVEANPVEGVLTNAIGTRNTAEACRKAGVAAMVLISTDKAINPSSVMGATKRLAEIYCQALDIAGRRRGAQGTRFITVRFGNVLGSTGSVVPLFHRQLAAGGPLTVTHPDMTRYFMTVREAVELVLQASALGAESPATEAGKIYVLDMGEPVKIIDLARQMIRLAGLRPDKDIQISITGPRPGEKLREEVFHEAEPLLPTSHPGLRLASPRTVNLELLSRNFDELAALTEQRRQAELMALVHRLVPEFGDPDESAGTVVAVS